MSDSNRSDRNSAVNTAFAILAAIVLVALIVGVLAFSQGKEWERRHQSPAEYAQAAKEHAANSCAGGEATAVFECVYEKVEASQAQAQSEQDLDAQQGMKFWAAVMAILAALTAFVTAIGVWLVKQTLDATLEAVEDTGNATKAMVEANQIAREIGRKQIRAYLGIGPVTIDDGEDRRFPKITSVITNNGVSPAEVVHVKQIVIWLGEGGGQVCDYSDKIDIRIHAGVPAFIPIHFDKDIDVCEGEGSFIVSIIVTYKDMFGDKHVEQGYFRTTGSVALFDMDWPDRLSPTPLKSQLAAHKAKRAAKGSEEKSKD